MKTYLWPVLLGLFISLFGLTIPPIAMLYYAHRIRWDGFTSTGGDGGEYSRTERGDIPGLPGRIFATPDERFPGGLNEPTVVGWLAKYGRVWCSYLWAGIRNRAMGLGHLLGKQTTGHLPDITGYMTNGDVWRVKLDLKLLSISFGWQVFGNVGPEKLFWAVPLFTLRPPESKPLKVLLLLLLATGLAWATGLLALLMPVLRQLA